MSAPWLGELPNGWQEIALRYLARIETGSRDTVDAVPGGEYPFIIRSQTPLEIDTYSYDTEAVLTAGDGAVGEIFHHINGRFEVHQRVYVMHDFHGLDGRYFYYYFSSEFGQTVAYGGAQSTVASLRRPMFTGFPVAVPPLEVQRAIANYLDRETAQIDAFIAKNEELITLLTERRASVASRAIDRGFPDVSVRHIVRLIQTGPFGSQLHSEDYVPGGHPLINPMHMIEGRAVPSSDVAISDEKADELRRHELTTDDLVVARRGELGRSALITRDEVGFICGTGSMLVRADSRRVVARYLQLAIGSERSRATLREQSVGSTMENLNAGALSALRVPLPPIDTQREILHELDAANARIDAALATARRSIELAGERRAALISAAVTGKIDVGVAV